MPELLSSAKSAVVKGQSQGRDETYVKQLSDYIIPNLVEALHKAVIYGVGVCAEFGGSVFNPLVGEALSRLDVVIRHPNALHADNIIAYDNVVSALGKICQFHRDSINAAQVGSQVLGWNPDNLEGCHLSSFAEITLGLLRQALFSPAVEKLLLGICCCSCLAKLLAYKRSDRELIGPNNQYLSKIVAVFAELDNDMRKCKEEFKEFERQDVKYREDFKHVNQKIKKLEDKVEKVEGTLIKEGEESTVLIPKLEDNIPKLQKLLLDEDKVLEEITESSKVETEKYRSELAKVRAELEPWEKDLIEHNGKLEVACTEAKLLNDKFNFLQIFAAKYDVAISTACHGLDYIVVETTNAAQACVELLRRENLGVATFMILEKQVDLLPKLKKNVSTPEGVPRFFDLVKVQDERIKLAFFAALRNTVVAKDLD
ncbi:hypothetical protein JHK82_039726 [Glycine max]|nr:hypothetical protein JHK86_039920 [Glycine max]KAG4965526.1 hypothetical protein JHK85_040501 [Glycine max]KAG5110503.1 hypothetical protein JHK82_039726 [Glycine max]KAG5121794.1 hypothetical protein JHK84_040134 [Glycine max]